ncbi:MAG: DUF1573 domain-containing protein [Bacteroidales bacterium]|nr:DUF1573 domain-containing protein [Bacteroidales bacterium]
MSKVHFVWLFIILLFTIIGKPSIAQNNKEKISKAQQYIIEGEYEEGNKIFTNLLKDDSTNLETRYIYALSLYRQQNTSLANKQFSYFIKSDKIINYEVYFYYAQTSKLLEKFQEAIFGYSKYIELGKNAEFRRISEQALESSKLALSTQNDNIEIEVIHLPPPINTPYSEFNAVQLSSNKIVFSRYYPQFTDSVENIFSQNYLSDIFLAKQTTSGWQNPKLYSKNLSSNRYFTANICYTENKREVYFTRCVDNSGQIGQCKIYHSKYKNGKWLRPKKVNQVNKDNFTSTQPNIVEFEDYQILYFCSNIPNGFGGNDIWYSIIRDGKIDNPINAGSIINTKGNEASPFYDKERETLYFSSDTHKGYGGFDIFKVAGSLSSFKELRNMGIGINSPANDLYYIKGIDDDIAFFSSNRKGSYFHGNIENCCTDIYKAILKPKLANPPLETENIDSTEIDSNVIAIKKLLPLSLYFENDMPNPKSIENSTNSNYKDLLRFYIEAKGQYKKEYAKGLSDNEAIIAENHIEDFFNKKVERGFSDLNKLVELLKLELTNKKVVRIKIRGFASPLNNSDYNLALSKRRIYSLKNFIREYDNGYFAKFMDNTNDSIHKLMIYEDPLGDSQSIGIVSNNPNDKRNSVYSREAALQRKIQIVMYNSDDILPLNESSFPILTWQNSEINIGEINKERNKTLIVYFTNTGESELEIKSITTECKFITMQNPQTTLQPNEKGKIYILVKSKKLKANSYNCDINFKTNSIKGNSKLQLTFKILE